MTNQKTPELLTVNRAAEILSCHPKTIRRLIDEDRLEACKVRGALRVTARSIDNYVKRQIQQFQLRDGSDF